MKNRIILCPICNNISDPIYTLNRNEILTKLQEYYNLKQQINKDISPIDYTILKCNNCTFEFVEPKIAGNKLFYDWITIQNPYYVNNRWEYHKVLEIVNNDRESNSLIDIGCGDGNFLELISTIKNLTPVGIDFTRSSIQNCLNKGFTAFCSDIKDFIKENPDLKFKYLTAFHVLEHVEDINEFLIDCKNLIEENGSIFISTPNCPTSYEYSNFDILNNPPHHLSRFNTRAYAKLASKLNMTINTYMPKPQNFIIRATKSTYLKKYNSQFPKFKLMLIKCIFIHTSFFIKELIKQFNREKINSITTSDIILVQLKKK